MMVQAEAWHRILCKLFDSCPAVPIYSDRFISSYYVNLIKILILQHKKAICCRIVQGGCELRRNSDG